MRHVLDVELASPCCRRFHRVYQYLVTNGLSTMFSGYARSLDLLMSHAWQSLDELRTGRHRLQSHKKLHPATKLW